MCNSSTSQNYTASQCKKQYATIATQMWLLGHILPLLVGEKVPDDDEKWMLFF